MRREMALNRMAAGIAAQSRRPAFGAQMANIRRNLAQTPARVVSRGTMRGTADTIHLKKSEKLGTLSEGLNRFEVKPGGSGAFVLDQIAKIFDLWHMINNFAVHVKSARATTADGQYTLGIDYNPGTTVLTEDQINALTGSKQDNVYKNLTVTVEKLKAQKQKWFSTKNSSTDLYQNTACVIYVWAPPGAESLGSVWLDYSVVFSTINTSAAAGSASEPQVVQTNPVIAEAPVPSLPQGAQSISVNQDEVPDLLIFEPTGLQEEDHTKIHTQIEFEHDGFKDPGDKIIIAGEVPVATAFNAAPSVTFRYKDGTPIPTGTIVPLATLDRSLRFYEEQIPDSVNDLGPIFSTIFKLALPLVKEIPIVGDIATAVFGGSAVSKLVYFKNGFSSESSDVLHYHHMLLATEDTVVEPVIVAAALGDSIDVVVPETLAYNWTDMLTQQATRIQHFTTAAGYTTFQSSVTGPYKVEWTDFASNIKPITDKHADYMKISTQMEQEPFRAGDIFSIEISAGVNMGAPLAYRYSNVIQDSDLTNLDFIDGLPAGTPGARLVAVLRDGESIFIKQLNDQTPSTLAAALSVMKITFTRVSRSDSKTVSPPPVASRTRRLEVSSFRKTVLSSIQSKRFNRKVIEMHQKVIPEEDSLSADFQNVTMS
jgi:hypothetical protein